MKITGYVKKLLAKDFQNEKELLKEKKYIIKVSEKCKSTKLFKDNIKKFEDFKNELKSECIKNKKSPIWVSYIHFLQKVVSAPTSFHMKYTPILTIPIIADCIIESEK